MEVPCRVSRHDKTEPHCYYYCKEQRAEVREVCAQRVIEDAVGSLRLLTTAKLGNDVVDKVL